jgi:hypothetical protein
LRDRRCHGLDLSGLFTLVAGDRTGEPIQDQVLAMLAIPLGQIVIAEPGSELG